MSTPEGKVKRKVSDYLRTLGPDCWYFMPVSTGYGAKSLDYIGCYQGKAFAIETKAPGNKLTPLQESTVTRMRAAGMHVSIVFDYDSLELMKAWFEGGDACH